MNFDALAIAAVADELTATLIDARVQRVVQINSLTFGWELFVHPIRYYLTLSVEPQTPYIYLSQNKTRRGSGNETPLMLVLRKYMRGARLRAIEHPPHERLLYLHFENYLGETTLVVEFLGPRSNMMLLEADSTILGMARLPKTNQRRRALLPGQLYAPPPTQTKLNPTELTELTLQQEFAEASPEFKLARLLPEIVRGVSPQMAREIVYRATGNVETLVKEWSNIQALAQTFQAFFAELPPYQASLGFQADDETPIAVAPYQLTHCPRTKPMPTFSLAVETYLAESAAAYTAARLPLLEAITEERKRLARRRERLQEDATARANPEIYRQKGEAILAHGHEIRSGQTQLVVNWLPDQPPLQITLDPTLSASDNAQQYFKRYRKSQRSEDEIPAQLEQISFDEQYLDQLEQDILMAEDRNEIDAVGGVMIEAGYYHPQNQVKKGAKKAIPTRYLRLQAPDGAKVWVGKNALQNAHLTFSKAAADDLWLHARGVPGAHVVIPTTEGLPSEDDVLWAASVAAYYSKARAEAYVDVAVTLKKYVRAIKGAAPGLVTYRNESTLRVSPQWPDQD